MSFKYFQNGDATTSLDNLYQGTAMYMTTLLTPPLSGPTIQPIFYLLSSTHIQAMTSQFLQENAEASRDRSFINVQVNNIHGLSLINQERHLVKGEQVS